MDLHLLSGYTFCLIGSPTFKVAVGSLTYVIVKTLFLHHHTFGQYLIAYTILALVHMFQLSRVSSSFRLLVWQHVQKQLV
jgi:hypothetical protein